MKLYFYWLKCQPSLQGGESCSSCPVFVFCGWQQPRMLPGYLKWKELKKAYLLKALLRDWPSVLSEYSVCIAFNKPIVTGDSQSHSFSPGLSENMPGVVDVRFAEREPAEKRRLLSWEQVKYPHMNWCRAWPRCTSVLFCVSFFFYL